MHLRQAKGARPVDRDRLDVEQAFVGFKKPVRGARLTLRLGRQLLPVELQRFVSVHDGPNLRQAYDAAYADYQQGAWRATGASARPSRYEISARLTTQAMAGSR